MTSTFAELGIPFRFFDGPTKQAAESIGLARCSLHRAPDRHGFEIGIGHRDIAVSETAAKRKRTLIISYIIVITKLWKRTISAT